ncbi:hypothetical protein ATCC90586_000924 [Pythium insidiosum]|nr:hypothetical protein ATCC90586_000924 [Pythium insidiosum]
MRRQESATARRIEGLLAKIQEVADALALPKSIVELATDIYAEAEKSGVSMRGPEKDSIPVAVLFIACRKSGNARSLKEFEAASGVPKKRIGKSFMTLSKTLDLDMVQASTQDYVRRFCSRLGKTLDLDMVQASTQDYVRRFCSRLGLPNKTQSIANDVAQRADELGLSSGKSPIAVAASVIYLVAAYTDAKRSLQEISDVSMIGEKNVKVVCKELNKSRVTLFEGVLMT